MIDSAYLVCLTFFETLWLYIQSGSKTWAKYITSWSLMLCWCLSVAYIIIFSFKGFYSTCRHTFSHVNKQGFSPLITEAFKFELYQLHFRIFGIIKGFVMASNNFFISKLAFLIPDYMRCISRTWAHSNWIWVTAHWIENDFFLPIMQREQKYSYTRQKKGWFQLPVLDH